jgi:hypothetical protein
MRNLLVGPGLGFGYIWLTMVPLLWTVHLTDHQHR